MGQEATADALNKMAADWEAGHRAVADLRRWSREELRNELVEAERKHPGYLARWAALDTLEDSDA